MEYPRREGLSGMNIFRSQLKLLHKLNEASLTIDEVRSYYDEAVVSFPDYYAAYTFASWFGFIKKAILIREDGRIISITVRGKEFLKYLVHCGYPDTARKF